MRYAELAFPVQEAKPGREASSSVLAAPGSAPTQVLQPRAPGPRSRTGSQPRPAALRNPHSARSGAGPKAEVGGGC